MSKMLDKKIWLSLMGIILLLMVGFYVYQVNDLVQNVYLRDQHKQKLAKLREKIKRSTVTVSRSQSLTQIDKAVKEKGFETVDNIEYLQVTDTQVAAAQ